MEREEFISGYCRTLDQSRMVAVLFADGRLEEADCLYSSCPHAADCQIAQRIREMTENAEAEM